MINKILSLFWSTKTALVLLVLILFFSAAGVILPPPVGKEVVFSSLWFNALLVLLIINIVFCIFKRIKVLRPYGIGTTVFHFSLVLLFSGVVYDQLFFFEGSIRLTEGETLSCAERKSYDWVRKGRFFQTSRLFGLGYIYLHKLHIPYVLDGEEKGVANEIAIGEDVEKGRNTFIYVTSPLKYKGFEIYRMENDGYSPLFVVRDLQGNVLYGGYAPLQSIMQKDGTYLYTSGSAVSPGSFNFPDEPDVPTFFKLQAAYYPDKGNRLTGDVFFQVWRAKPHGPQGFGDEEELFKGRAVLGKAVRVEEYWLSMDEVRQWTSMKVIYRPGMPIIFGSFWVGLAGLILSVVLKLRKAAG